MVDYNLRLDVSRSFGSRDVVLTAYDGMSTAFPHLFDESSARRRFGD